MQRPAGSCGFRLKAATGWGEDVEHRTQIVVFRLLIQYPHRTGPTLPLLQTAQDNLDLCIIIFFLVVIPSPDDNANRDMMIAFIMLH